MRSQCSWIGVDGSEELSLVFVDRVPNGVTRSAITSDNCEGAAVATRHLLELGHHRIALLAGRLTISAHFHRLEGFRNTMDAAGISVLPEYAQECEMQIENAYQTAKKLLGLRVRPTAIMASNNKLLLGLLRALHEANLNCPSQLSVLGFDDHPWNEHLNPRLTTLVQPTYEMGRPAFEMLLRRMRPDPYEANRMEHGVTFLKPELKVRESTAPPVD